MGSWDAPRKYMGKMEMWIGTSLDLFVVLLLTNFFLGFVENRLFFSELIAGIAACDDLLIV